MFSLVAKGPEALVLAPQSPLELSVGSPAGRLGSMVMARTVGKFLTQNRGHQVRDVEVLSHI